MNRAPLSAIIIVGALVFPETSRGDAVVTQMIGRTDARQLEKSGRLDRSGTEDHLPASLVWRAVLELHARGAGAVKAVKGKRVISELARNMASIRR